MLHLYGIYKACITWYFLLIALIDIPCDSSVSEFHSKFAHIQHHLCACVSLVWHGKILEIMQTWNCLDTTVHLCFPCTDMEKSTSYTTQLLCFSAFKKKNLLYWKVRFTSAPMTETELIWSQGRLPGLLCVYSWFLPVCPRGPGPYGKAGLEMLGASGD